MPRLALACFHPNHAELGLIGEALAARYLRRRGDRIRVRRLHTRFAEVDLLTRRGETWCCVEVKTGRLGADYSPGMRLRNAQLGRLRQAAAGLGRGAGSPFQVDLVEVCLDKNGRLLELRHHANLKHVLPRGRKAET